MPELVMPIPNEKQKLFLTDHHKFVAFGGARGGGKSWSIRTKSILLCERFPGIICMIVRRTYPELMANHIRPLQRTLHVYDPDPRKRMAKYNGTDKSMTFPNGSLILFRYCENDKDAERFQGTEVDVLFLDEATHQTEERVRKLTACVRGVNDFPHRIYYTCNPGGVGHAWVKRLFIDRKFKESEDPEDYSFIQSLVGDNKILMEKDPDYVKQLEALPPKLREAWLHGRWDIFEGQVFEEFLDVPEHYADRIGSHVIDPFLVPKDWKILRGFDWGYSKPFSVGWYAVDHENRIYRIRELYGCTQTPNEGVKLAPREVGKMIYEVEHSDPNLKGRKIRGIADPAIFEKSTGRSIAEDMDSCQVYFEPGDHSRIPGKMQCHYRLHMDENGIPMFYVFNSCPHFIRTIPLLIYDEKKVEDIDTDMEDHIYDEWRYVMMEYPLNPEQIMEKRKTVGTDGKLDPLGMMTQPRYSRYDCIRRL